MSDNISLSVTLLITGFVVVFLVLILLIAIIKLYSTAVYNAQNRSAQKKAEKERQARLAEQEALKKEQVVSSVQSPSDEANGAGVSLETVAGITAAVDAMYGTGRAKVKSIKRLPRTRPVWSTAGLMDQTKPF